MFLTNDSVHAITTVGDRGCIYLFRKGIEFNAENYDILYKKGCEKKWEKTHL